MSVADVVAVIAAGMAAGTINVIVGSGTLITFPVLLAVGLAPVTANVSNTIGLVPASVAGAIGYRRELTGLRATVLRLAAASFAGAVVGAVLLLTLPQGVFKPIAAGLVVVALGLVLAQPRLAAKIAARSGGARPGVVPALVGGVFLTGVYGGYFGAAQGIILLGLMGLALEQDLQHINAIKNVLAGLVNAVAAVIFIATAHIAWGHAALVAAGATAGGLLGTRLARRLAPGALRAVIVVVGVAAIVQLVR